MKYKVMERTITPRIEHVVFMVAENGEAVKEICSCKDPMEANTINEMLNAKENSN